MKNLLPAALLCGLLSAHAQEPRVFSSYEELYASLPARLFTGDGEEIAVSSRHSVRIDGKQYRLNRALAFPGEDVYPADLGKTATLYRSAGHYCIEGTGSSSGTGSRHLSVYLMEARGARIRKLPSLFGSCKGIALDGEKRIRFFLARIIDYRAAYDAEGVEFIEYADDGKSSVPSGEILRTRFVETGNFYRFTLREN
ncbi:hypothetical protein Herbaro_06950 [Herbaspirillum sp. WKF16]|uniref:hypothetical protein n=1 Tax=Herbaspirillum sp. WKF16 TaxID=3028312 RepID=UPI0023A9CB96|nr:hypothetical protein [Herbaspirillum sp. WKF16]WDZ97523.1 hypothetical protein Herbaro_06950 [Herbaspirillum sp. WKF16]